MVDHVAIAVSDLAASERSPRAVLGALGAEPGHADAALVEWEDRDIGPADREHPVTCGLHVGFRAGDRARVDAFWRAGVDAGYRDDGAPGPRPRWARSRHVPGRALRAISLPWDEQRVARSFACRAAG